MQTDRDIFRLLNCFEMFSIFENSNQMPKTHFGPKWWFQCVDIVCAQYYASIGNGKFTYIV